MASGRRTPLRRALAAMVAVSLVAAFAPPLRGSLAAASGGHCDHPLPAGVPSWAGPGSSGSCHSGSGAGCAAMPQCAASTPAIEEISPATIFPTAPALAAPVVLASIHGRFALGPPTPPPNS